MPRKAVRELLKIAMVDPIICCDIGLWFLGVRCKKMEQVGCRNTDRYHRKIRQHLSGPKTLDPVSSRAQDSHTMRWVVKHKNTANLAAMGIFERL